MTEKDGNTWKWNQRFVIPVGKQAHVTVISYGSVSNRANLIPAEADIKGKGRAMPLLISGANAGQAGNEQIIVFLAGK